VSGRSLSTTTVSTALSSKAFGRVVRTAWVSGTDVPSIVMVPAALPGSTAAAAASSSRRRERAAMTRLLLVSLLLDPVLQNPDDFSQHRLLVLPEMVGDLEDVHNRIEVQHQPADQYRRGERRDPGPQLRTDVRELMQHVLEPRRHLFVEPLDVMPFELDHVNVDEGNMTTIFLDALPRGVAEPEQVVGKGAIEHGLVERELARANRLPELVEER